MAIRQPIVVVLGHVDHGKTTLLDKIRGTKIASGEAGAITQHIGASVVPAKIIQKICGGLLKKMGVELKIPGLLFVDTPGHEAFTNLRKRGGNIADMAVLVIDITQGIQPQTKEAMDILRINKVPFIIAASKIDMLMGWEPHEDATFMETFKEQHADVQKTLDKKVYDLVGAMYENGEFNCERFDRVDDFTKQIGIIPISAKTGEGVPELMMFLAGLTQRYMGEKLEISEEDPAKGTVLEVKEEQGLGTTLDVIIYDGKIKQGDLIAIGGQDKIVKTKIRALLVPAPLQEIRDSKNKFSNIKEAYASAGVKISAPGLEDVVAGASLRVIKGNEAEIEKELTKELDTIRFEKTNLGIVLVADALGSLEALVKMLGDKGIPVKSAKVGKLTRRDVIEAEAVKDHDPYLGTVFAFHTTMLKEAEEEANDAEVKVFSSAVIYKIIEDYEEWVKEAKKDEKEMLLKQALYPAKIQLLPGHTFRQSKPAIVGIEVLEGTLKNPCPLMTEQGKRVGKIKGIQEDGKNVPSAVKGKRVAVSINGVTVGRQINENDVLYTNIPLNQIDKIEHAVRDEDDKALLQYIRGIKKKNKEAI